MKYLFKLRAIAHAEFEIEAENSRDAEALLDVQLENEFDNGDWEIGDIETVKVVRARPIINPISKDAVSATPSPSAPPKPLGESQV